MKMEAPDNSKKNQIKSWLTVAAAGAILTAFVFYESMPRNNATNNPATILRDKIDFSVTQPLPTDIALDPEKVALGAKLFNEKLLSRDNTVSCANCHVLSAGGMDGQPRSLGIQGQMGQMNAPTVFNSGLNFSQFWDGRASSLESQIDGPIHHPLEMGSNWQEVIKKLNAIPGYVNSFAHLYKSGITEENIKSAIAIFEKSLITPNSRFDKFLRGDQSAISGTEKRGYELFQSYGCASCHQGINLGGNMYEKMGLMGDYFADRGNPTEADNGRFNINKNIDSMHEFKVPSLRNVALTAPYFHDGSTDTLEDAIRVMAKYQLGRPMQENDVKDIADFLRTLTGEYEGKPL